VSVVTPVLMGVILKAVLLLCSGNCVKCIGLPGVFF